MNGLQEQIPKQSLNNQLIKVNRKIDFWVRNTEQIIGRERQTATFLKNHECKLRLECRQFAAT